MSQLDLTAQLRGARPVVPAELRELVRASRPRPTRSRGHGAASPGEESPSWPCRSPPRSPQRSSARGGKKSTARFVSVAPAGRAEEGSAAGTATDAASSGARRNRVRSTLPAPSRTRLQNYSATLQLRVKNGTRSPTRRNRRCDRPRAGRLPEGSTSRRERGKGYATSCCGSRSTVQEAVRRLSALGTIVGENVSIQDLQGQVDSTDPHDRTAKAHSPPGAPAADDRDHRSTSPRSPTRSASSAAAAT